MKTLVTKIYLIMILAAALLASCKKEAETVQPEKSIIEDPAAYVVYVRVKTSGGSIADWIFNFTMDKKVQVYDVEYYPGTPISNTYEIKGDTIKIKNAVVNITKDNVLLIGAQSILQQFAILKKQPTNQFADKVFTGTYYRSDGSVLHPIFYYQFHPTNITKKVGRVFPNADREDAYILIGGVAAIWNKISGYPGDVESMVMIGDKLNVNYRDKHNFRMYHGVFSKQ